MADPPREPARLNRAQDERSRRRWLTLRLLTLRLLTLWRSAASDSDDKGLTWRKNYLNRLQNAGYKRDEFAGGKPPHV